MKEQRGAIMPEALESAGPQLPTDIMEKRPLALLGGLTAEQFLK